MFYKTKEAATLRKSNFRKRSRRLKCIYLKVQVILIQD